MGNTDDSTGMFQKLQERSQGWKTAPETMLPLGPRDGKLCDPLVDFGGLCVGFVALHHQLVVGMCLKVVGLVVSCFFT